MLELRSRQRGLSVLAPRAEPRNLTDWEVCHIEGRCILGGIFATVLAMMGCAPTITCSVSVNSFAASNASAYQTYIVLPLNPSVQETDLQFQEFNTYVRRTLDARGFRPARSFDDAQIAVF